MQVDFKEKWFGLFMPLQTAFVDFFAQEDNLKYYFSEDDFFVSIVEFPFIMMILSGLFSGWWIYFRCNFIPLYFVKPREEEEGS